MAGSFYFLTNRDDSTRVITSRLSAGTGSLSNSTFGASTVPLLFLSTPPMVMPMLSSKSGRSTIPPTSNPIRNTLKQRFLKSTRVYNGNKHAHKSPLHHPIPQNTKKLTWIRLTSPTLGVGHRISRRAATQRSRLGSFRITSQQLILKRVVKCRRLLIRKIDFSEGLTASSRLEVSALLICVRV